MGRRSLWLLIPVLLYVVLPVWLLTSHLPQALSIAMVIAIIALAFASLVTSGLAIFREKERSVVVVVLASLTFLIVVTLAVGEFLGGH
jgi:thiol:disulfide interchange protein